VLFPALGRAVATDDTDGLRALQARGVRTIVLLLVPAAALTAILAVPIVQLVYQRGEFGPASTQLVADALIWFSVSLPFAGANLLLTRTFFAMRAAWIPTFLALGNLIVNAIISFALYKPLGIAGPVIGTVIASIGMTAGQLWFLRKRLGHIEMGTLVSSTIQVGISSAISAVAAWGVWSVIDSALGESLLGQLASVGGGLAVGIALYGVGVMLLKVPEAIVIRDRLGQALRARRG
ncbi:MAG: lipid II flippase MurJ, partial [Actinomycetes bacterium]